MELKKYFEDKKGIGVLATADSSGNVNAAIYSRPHFLEENTLTFIVRNRLTRHNLQSNPKATFLFVEKGPGYSGKRLYLRKIREEQNLELIEEIERRKFEDTDEPRFLVYFELEKELPLIGSGEG